MEAKNRSRDEDGLWLDSKALFKDELAKVLATLPEGIASDDHQRLVEELARRKRSSKRLLHHPSGCANRVEEILSAF